MDLKNLKLNFQDENSDVGDIVLKCFLIGCFQFIFARK